MTKSVVRIGDILEEDVDDVTRLAVSLSTDEKVAALRDAAAQFEDVRDDIARTKLLLFVQAALASLTTRNVPVGTATAMISHVEPLATSVTDKVARRAALQVLALLFLKARQLTAGIDKPVRAAFRAARADDDETVRAFAKQALGTGGVLRRRSVGGTGHAGVHQHVRSALTVPAGILVSMKKRINKQSPAKTTRVASKAQRKSPF